jgi:ADP-heptose:LPS heptosyltransferase
MRILINASTSIGDSLYFAFMLDNLYRFYPQATFHLLCWHPMVTFYQNFPFIAQVIPYDQIKKDELFGLFLLKPPIDIFIDLQHTRGSAEMCKATGARQRIGVNPHPATYACYTHIIPLIPGEHIQEAFYQGFCTLWPDKEITRQLHVRLSADDEHAAESLLAAHSIVKD